MPLESRLVGACLEPPTRRAFVRPGRSSRGSAESGRCWAAHRTYSYVADGCPFPQARTCGLQIWKPSVEMLFPRSAVVGFLCPLRAPDAVQRGCCWGAEGAWTALPDERPSCGSCQAKDVRRPDVGLYTRSCTCREPPWTHCGSVACDHEGHGSCPVCPPLERATCRNDTETGTA